ncbi:hypothetical protein ABHF33_12455 [Chitinibacter sp. FCG-7]|uniref:PPM-type phosphatase domain-containing protein n=1 Tax=Chitinibacter mangrovi TaxID=3153927 RepID=A0AAU7F5D4_9NEIS
MNAIPHFDCSWVSIKGFDQAENRDAGGVFACGTYTFAVIMDASGHGTKAISFTAIWLKALLALLPESTPTADSVVQLMREAHQKLREARLFQERACFAALLIPHDRSPCTAFISGDCRIGSQPKVEEVHWLTPVHTLEAASAKVFNDVGGLVNRQLVTRVLKARRFDPPELMQLSHDIGQAWILATDGFWRSDCSAEKLPSDDCSFLRLHHEGTSSVQQHHDDDNLHLVGIYAT